MSDFFASQAAWYLSMILVVPAILFSGYAQFKVSSTFNRYLSVPARNRMTGRDAARKILDANGLESVSIHPVGGKLSDHYDPRNRTVCLSPEVYNGNSIAAVSVACHECGHAIQHSKAYKPLALRSAIVPLTNIASGLAIPLFLIGMFLGYPGFQSLGILFFAVAVIFQGITLPVEFNASSRAIAQMEQAGVIYVDERSSAQKVLGAAALTYVAAMLVSLLQLIRLIILSRARN